MAGLTENWDTRMSEGRVICYPVQADAVIYTGAILVLDAGYVRPSGATETGLFVGIAADSVDATGRDSGDLKVRVIKTGAHNFQATGLVAADLGKLTYAPNDGSVSLSDTAGPEVGYLVGLNANGTVRVRIDRSVC